MGDIPQNTSVHSIVQAQIIPQTQFYTINPQPIQIIKCGTENIQNIESTNNITEILTLLKTILEKQESMEKRIEEIEKSAFNTEILISKHIIETSEMIAQNQFIPDCKIKEKEVCSVAHTPKKIKKDKIAHEVPIEKKDALLEGEINEKLNEKKYNKSMKKVHSVARTPEKVKKDIYIKIAAELPIETMDALLEVELKLNEKEYNKAMVAFIKKIKDSTGSVDKVLRQIFADALTHHFNWDGRCGKKALNSLKLIDQVVFEMFQADGRNAFKRNGKKYVVLSHNRWKKKVSLEKKNKRNKLLSLEKNNQQTTE